LVPHAARASVAIGHRRSPSAQSRGQRPQFAAIEFAAPGVSIPHYGWLPASRSAVSSFFTREMSLILSVEVRRDLDTHRGGRIHGQTTSRDGRSRQPSGWSAGQPRSWMRASLARSRRRPAGPCGCSQVMALTSLQNAPLGRRLGSKRLPNAPRASVAIGPGGLACGYEGLRPKRPAPWSQSSAGGRARRDHDAARGTWPGLRR
jgi:hypothetical protein